MLVPCGSQQVHIGVEQNFRPAKKGHLAFVTPDLDELRQALLARSINVSDDDSIPGTRHFHTEDPWGNRLEFIESPPPKTV
jgi:hypothetical protein